MEITKVDSERIVLKDTQTIERVINKSDLLREIEVVTNNLQGLQARLVDLNNLLKEF